MQTQNFHSSTHTVGSPVLSTHYTLVTYYSTMLLLVVTSNSWVLRVRVANPSFLLDVREAGDAGDVGVAHERVAGAGPADVRGAGAGDVGVAHERVAGAGLADLQSIFSFPHLLLVELQSIFCCIILLANGDCLIRITTLLKIPTNSLKGCLFWQFFKRTREHCFDNSTWGKTGKLVPKL